MAAAHEVPIPLFHLHGTNPCGGIALFIVKSAVELDKGETLNVRDMRSVKDGGALTKEKASVCGSCGKGLEVSDFRQALAAYTGPRVDPFKAALMAAQARAHWPGVLPDGVPSTAKKKSASKGG